jgi:hypothetical protein
MLQRDVAENIEGVLKNNPRRIIFAGFNALTKAEERMFSYTLSWISLKFTGTLMNITSIIRRRKRENSFANIKITPRWLRLFQRIFLPTSRVACEVQIPRGYREKINSNFWCSTAGQSRRN